MTLTAPALDAMTNALTSLLDDGFLNLYAGEPPANPYIPTDQKLLASLRFRNPAFSPAVSGAAEAELVFGDFKISKGRAIWYRCFQADGVPVLDGPVGLDLDPAMAGRKLPFVIELGEFGHLTLPEL